MDGHVRAPAPGLDGKRDTSQMSSEMSSDVDESSCSCSVIDNNGCFCSNSSLLENEYDAFWKNQLLQYQPTMFTRQKLNSSHGLDDNCDTLPAYTTNFKLPDTSLLHRTQSPSHMMEGWHRVNMVNCLAETKPEFLSLATFITFMARICCSDIVHVGLVADMSDVLPEKRHLYSRVVPAIFRVRLQSPHQSVLYDCFKTLKKISNAIPLRKTVIHSADTQQPGGAHHNLVLMACQDFEQLDGQALMTEMLDICNILVTLTPSEIHFTRRDALQNRNCKLVDIMRHYPVYVSSLFSLSPEHTILDAQLLTDEEMCKLYPAPQSQPDQPDLFSLFHDQAVRSLHSLALKSTQCQLTYKETLRVVTDLADLLQQHLPHGYDGHKGCIGLYLPKSLAYVVSTLACVRTKCPFLPLPADLPAERLVFTLLDAGVRVLITGEGMYSRDEFPHALSGSRVLVNVHVADLSAVILQTNMNGDKELPAQEQNTTSKTDTISNSSEHLEDDCCYVMYTSGSTGRPKGVQVRLPGVVNMAGALISDLGLQPTDVTAQFASIGFDTSIWEIFPTLLSGGTLAVLYERERLGKEFVKAMTELQVSVVTLTPSVINLYEPADLPTLRKIAAAGETCMLNTALKWTEGRGKQSSDVIRFFNAYGPTETTVGATIYEFKREDYPDHTNQELSIGKAMKGVDVYLLDKFMKPVPPGVVGEIYIGGAGVSAGYIGHAAFQNKFRFVPNPFTDPIQEEGVTERKQTLLHKSGDHAIQDENGRLTFLGRLDSQVKIRGQRVDLAEVEQVLMQTGQVEMAVVVKHRCIINSDPIIAAFVTPASVSVTDLLQNISQQLPKFMVPNFIRLLDASALPMSVNRKVDRAALETDESVHESLIVASSMSQPSQIQAVMAEMWTDILGLRDSDLTNIHPETSFSALGGSSIHLVILQHKIEETFQIRVSFDDVVTAETLQDYCDIVAKTQEIWDDESVDGDFESEHLRTMIFEDSCLECNCKELLDESCLDCGICSDTIEDHVPLTAKVAGGAWTLEESEQRSNNSILVSGVTGFLGAFLLHELLNQTDAQITCLARGKSVTCATQRVVDNLTKYGLWKEAYSLRISVVVCDISQPRLGLEAKEYHDICSNTYAVFVNAAKINFNTSYRDHRGTNVLGTREFVRIAMTGTKKFLFLVSSLSVFLFPPEVVTKQNDDPYRLAVSSTQSSGRHGENICNDDFVRQGQNEIDGDYINHQISFSSTVKNVLSQAVCKHPENGQHGNNENISDCNHVSNNSCPNLTHAQSTGSCSLCTSQTLVERGIVHLSDSEIGHVQNAGCDRPRTHVLTVKETDMLTNPLLVEGGYGQSKWVSDRLVQHALRHLPGGAIFRPGHITGRSTDGAGPCDDMFARCLTGIPEFGSVPDVDFPFDLLPVDFCARAIVEIAVKCIKSVQIGETADKCYSSKPTERYISGTANNCYSAKTANVCHSHKDVQRCQNKKRPNMCHRRKTVSECHNVQTCVQLSNSRVSSSAAHSTQQRREYRGDECAEACHAPMPTVYHLYNQDTVPFKDLFPGLPVVPLADWRRELKSLRNESPLVPLTPYFMSPFWDRVHCYPNFCTCNTETHVSADTARLLRPAKELLTLYRQCLSK